MLREQARHSFVSWDFIEMPLTLPKIFSHSHNGVFCMIKEFFQYMFVCAACIST